MSPDGSEAPQRRARLLQREEENSGRTGDAEPHGANATPWNADSGAVGRPDVFPRQRGCGGAAAPNETHEHSDRRESSRVPFGPRTVTLQRTVINFPGVAFFGSGVSTCACTPPFAAAPGTTASATTTMHANRIMPSIYTATAREVPFSSRGRPAAGATLGPAFSYAP